MGASEKGAMLLDFGDFFGDELVLAMDYSEIGIYLKLLSIQWHQGSIPKDRKRLARLLRVHEPDLGLIDEKLEIVLECFEETDEGRLQNKRCSIEREIWSSKKKMQSDKARDAANARWEQVRERRAQRVQQERPEHALGMPGAEPDLPPEDAPSMPQACSEHAAGMLGDAKRREEKRREEKEEPERAVARSGGAPDGDGSPKKPTARQELGSVLDEYEKLGVEDMRELWSVRVKCLKKTPNAHQQVYSLKRILPQLKTGKRTPQDLRDLLDLVTDRGWGFEWRFLDNHRERDQFQSQLPMDQQRKVTREPTHYRKLGRGANAAQ